MSVPTPSDFRPGHATPARWTAGLRSRTNPVAMFGPLATAVAGGFGVATLARFDPTTSPWYPDCPFHAATGLWCPGCGLTRAARHLVRGDLAGSLSSNALLPVLVVAAAAGWFAWFQTQRGRHAPAVLSRWRPAWTVALVVAVAAFTVARNLTPFAALAP